MKHRYISALFGLLVFILVGCGYKKITEVELKNYFQETFDCVKVQATRDGMMFFASIDEVPQLTIVKPIPGSKVVKDSEGKEYLDYYTPNRGFLPEKSNTNSIKHLYVHHFVYHVTDAGVDSAHQYARWYLECSGLQAE